MVKKENGLLSRWFPTPQFVEEAGRKVSVLHYGINLAAFVIVCYLALAASALLQAAILPLCVQLGWPRGVLEAINNGLEFAGIVVVVLACLLIERRGPRTLGFVRSGWLKEYLVGLGIGFVGFVLCVLMGMAFGVVRVTGFVPQVPWGSIILLFGGYLIQGMNEEVLSRGYFMVSLDRKMSPWAGCLISAAFFSIMHLTNPGVGFLSVLNVFLVGVFLGLLFLRRGSLWMASGFHSAWNFTQGNLFGFAVSGNEKETAVLSAQILPGNILLTGGEFGLEATVFTTVLTVAGIVAVLAVKPVDRSAQ